MADIDAPLAWRMQQDGYLMQINKLRDENTKLREEVERLRSVVSDGTDNAHEIVAENTELREHCASLFRLANYACLGFKIRCDDCPMGKGKPQCDLVRDFIAIRKLGIDVTPWEVESVGGDNV